MTLTATATEAYTSSPSNGLLHGTYTQGTVSAGNYVLQKQGDDVAFCLVESGSEPTINPFRAYLSAPSPARVLTFSFVDESAGIESTVSVANTRHVYTVNGVRQQTLQSGVNIVRMNDGSVRKVINK